MFFKTLLLLTYHPPSICAKQAGQAGDLYCPDEDTEDARGEQRAQHHRADCLESQDLNLGLPSLNSGCLHLPLVVWGKQQDKGMEVSV